MIAHPQRRTFTLAPGREATFQFFWPDRFMHVLRDHILNNKEPWSRLLHVRLKRLDNLCQQLGSSDVVKRNEAEAELYAQCVEILAQGITEAAEQPVYVEFVQQRRPSGTNSSYRTAGFYFVARAGFLVVVRADVVRTAWFEVGIKKGLSRVGLFREAWKHVQMRITRSTEYLDDKDQEYVLHVQVHPVSLENWARCPV
jgi:hypothetical protein